MHVFADKMAETDSADWLLELLQDVQLEQFYVKLRDNLQLTRQVVLTCDFVWCRCFVCKIPTRTMASGANADVIFTCMTLC